MTHRVGYKNDKKKHDTQRALTGHHHFRTPFHFTDKKDRKRRAENSAIRPFTKGQIYAEPVMAIRAILFVALATTATATTTATSVEAANLGLINTWLDRTSILPSLGIDAGNLTSSVRQSISACLELAKRFADGFFPDEAYLIWRRVRAHAIAPLLNALINVSMVMSVMLVVEALFMSSVSLFAKLLRRTPEKRYKWEAIKGDEEGGSSAYPMVLVQIPMFNEKEVYKLSIAAACALTWPSDRIIVQVLDDSTDPAIKDLVALECQAWASKGASIKYEERENRKGHKAGALKKGLEHSYVQQCDFVAIFDADFQPESDFLIRTIPFLLYNSQVALVQARWAFVNYNKCLLTRMQRMYLDYHFKVEQESGSSSFGFFGFNGSAGVWRLSAINNAGGWKDRTTVEDMDLAVRAGLKGWRFIYVDDVRVKSELPSTYKAYRHQQHRWVSGAANLFRRTAWGIVTAKEVSIWMKIHVLYSFFFVRRVIAPIVTFVLYCVVIPVSVMVPEVTIPILVASYIPTTVTILTAIRSPRALHILPCWILLENVMAMHRMRAAVMGLLDTATVHEWVVTKKLGDTTLKKNPQNSMPKLNSMRFDRVSFAHLGFAAFLIFCGTYNAMFGKNYYHVYIYIQAFAHVVAVFGNFSTCISSS